MNDTYDGNWWLTYFLFNALVCRLLRSIAPICNELLATFRFQECALCRVPPGKFEMRCGSSPSCGRKEWPEKWVTVKWWLCHWSLMKHCFVSPNFGTFWKQSRADFEALRQTLLVHSCWIDITTDFNNIGVAMSIITELTCGVVRKLLRCGWRTRQWVRNDLPVPWRTS